MTKNFDNIKTYADGIRAAGALLAAGVITQRTHERLVKLLNFSKSYAGQSIYQIQAQWNEIVEIGKREMADDQWKEFQDKRWTDTYIPKNPHRIMSEDEKNHEILKRKRGNEVEESKVETDDYFETTYKENEKRKKKQKEPKQQNWVKNIASAVSQAKKIDKTLKKIAPKNEYEDKLNPQIKKPKSDYKSELEKFWKDQPKEEDPVPDAWKVKKKDPDDPDDPNGGSIPSKYSFYNLHND